MKRTFTVDIEDYEAGTDQPLTAADIEGAILAHFEDTGDDGTIIVREYRGAKLTSKEVKKSQ